MGRDQLKRRRSKYCGVGQMVDCREELEGRVWETVKETVAWCKAMRRVRVRAKSMPVGEAARYIAHDSVFWEITLGLGWRKASWRR